MMNLLAFDKKVETIIYDGWGFVTPNEKSGTYNITENNDGITFQTTVGGIFIVAQMDPDNGKTIYRIYRFADLVDLPIKSIRRLSRFTD